jgi:hypothetical protein
MPKSVRRAVIALFFLSLSLSLSPSVASAQPFEGVGARAQGMGGAFVAVADDASAVYWNPGGLASGAYFSLVLDRTQAETNTSSDGRAGGRSSWLLALSAPAIGLTYYRLRHTFVAPAGRLAATPLSRVESLVTHHAGATLVHSVFDHLAVGTTLKIVSGIAALGDAPGDPADLIDDRDIPGVSSTKFDADVGVMATGTLVRAGVTFRNLAEPSFATGTEEKLHLNRQARAGLALLLTPRWTAAADLDLTRNRGPFGDVRTLAFGTEGRLTTRASARAGVQMNTTGDRGRTPLASVGASYAAFGSLLVDAHFSKGSDNAFSGWGVAGRVVF